MGRGLALGVVVVLALTFAFGCSQPQNQTDDHEQQGQDLLRRFGQCNAAWNAHDREALAGCYAPGAVRSYVAALPETVLTGADAIADKDAAFWRGVSDARRQIEIAIAGQRELAIAFFVSGTHSAELAGIAATQKPLSYRIAMWIELDDSGLIAREHVWADATSQHAQLGIELRPDSQLSDTMRDVSVSLASARTAAERAHLALFERHNAAHHAADWDEYKDTLGPEAPDWVAAQARDTYVVGMSPRTITTWLAAGPWLAVRFLDGFPAARTGAAPTDRTEPGDGLSFFRINDGKLSERVGFENTTRWWADGRGLDPAALRFGGL